MLSFKNLVEMGGKVKGQRGMVKGEWSKGNGQRGREPLRSVPYVTLDARAECRLEVSISDGGGLMLKRGDRTLAFA